MEEVKVENDLRLCEVKRENLRQAMGKVKSQATDLFAFSVQWADLEEYLKFAEENVEKKLRVLKSKEMDLEEKSFELEERVKLVEAAEDKVGDLEMKADGFMMEIEEKEKQLGFLKNQVEVCQGQSKAEEIRLAQLRKWVEECTVEHRSKTSQLYETVELLRKTQVDVDLNGEKLGKMETDLERYRVEASAEMEHLGRSQTRRRELEEEIERRTNDLTSVLEKTGECEKLIETRSTELRKTQSELELKGKQLEHVNVDFKRHRVEVTAEEEHLRRTQDQRRVLEEEIERRMKVVTAIVDKIAERGKQLELVEKQLDSQQKLLETQSSELVSKEKELEGLREAKISSILEHDLREQMVKSLNNDMTETSQQMESKAKELEDIERAIEERSAHCESIKLLIEEHSEELASKEKRQNEMTEAIRKLSLEIVSEEKTLERAKVFIQQLSDKQHSKEKKLLSTERDLERYIEELDSEKKELRSVKNSLKECLQNLETKENMLKSLQSVIIERNKQIEEREKKMQHLDKSNEELLRQLQVKQEQVCSINNAIRECSGELASKRKQRDQVQSSIGALTAELKLKECDLNSVKKKIQDSLKDCSGELESKKKQRDQVQSSITALTAELKLKECDLNSVKKKIQDSLKDFQSKEEQQVKLKASLMEREQELRLKEKQFDARSEKIKLKEKELDTREENIAKKDQQLKSTEQKLAKCVKDYELKAKKLSSFCQQSNPDQHVNLVRDANVCDEKTLQLLLQGLLKKCPQLHLDVSRALKTSSDPAKLVLDTVQGLYSADQRMAISNRDPNGVRRSVICLLDCLMDMSPKPKTEIQEEAIKFAIEWKTTTLVTAENPVEVLSFLHFLAAFSLAYTFDADKIHNLFDAAFLCKYAPSLCKALGVSALAPVTNEQQPPEAPINNSSDSRSLEVQEKAAVSQLANEDVLRDHEVLVPFSPSEVSNGLPLIDDPGMFVLNSVKDALTGSHQRGESGLAEPIVKTLIPLLEELTRVISSIDPDLRLDATKVAKQWSRMMATSSHVSPLEALSFLQFIVSFELVDLTDKDETLRFASYVAHLKQAPKLFQSLGLSYAIPNFVKQLLNEHQYIQAIRFMFSFNLNNKFSTLQLLREQIISLRLSAKEKRRFESQAEDRDAGILRDIIELIDDFKLEIDLPVDMIVKFMVPRETQNQNQCVVSSSVPIQPLQMFPQVRMQASHTVIHSPYLATHGLDQRHPTRLGLSRNQQILDVEAYQASGSAAFQGQSSQRVGYKRPRVDSQGPRSTIRPCLNPSGRDRF
ncbi:unnamed protein product [Arabis nemorensis]|uniref:FRIGIDA-like protein n=1 Tax=Arabis nemorensis TaxID=586526 RepID=A0A565CNY5_9BRAS|nr:unnamed protein product [Arabis nemorensis]